VLVYSCGRGFANNLYCVGTTGSFAFANDDAVLASVSYQYDPKLARYETGTCVLNLVTSGRDRFIAADVGYDLTDPSLSPSGTLLALTRAVPGHGEGAIALYDYSSGRLVRQLTNGATDAAGDARRVSRSPAPAETAPAPRRRVRPAPPGRTQTPH
jgi:hypothetical protein